MENSGGSLDIPPERPVSKYSRPGTPYKGGRAHAGCHFLPPNVMVISFNISYISIMSGNSGRYRLFL